MGPLVPDIITNELNLVIALLVGIAFGFILEQAGFSSSRKLTGLFYGTDFTVLRVFFTAGVTAMSGVLIATQLGWLDPDLIYINPMFVQSAIVGGVIMGVGFVLGGYCPGTSFCGVAVGRIDAMAFAVGGVLGIFAFGEAFPMVENLYRAGAKGDLLISTAFGLTDGQFAAVMIAVAVGAFVVTTRIEKKVNLQSTAYFFPTLRHAAAGAALLVLAAGLFAMPDRKARLMEATLKADQKPVQMIAADELAIHILDRDARYQLVDVREAPAFAKATLPGAVNFTPAALFSKDARGTLAGRHTVKVFFGADEAASVRAAMLARELGQENVAALEGGYSKFASEILAAGPSGQGEVAEFRQKAGVEIAALLKQMNAPKPVKVVRRVQGGCGG